MAHDDRPTFGSLFSGIGGIDLGLERAGWRCAYQVELDDYRRAVLAQWWPDVPRHRDIASLDLGTLAPVDLIAGGFPCQDLSHAGRRAGIEGEQSGLWSYFAQAVRVLRPQFVLVENVTGLLSARGGGLGRVVGDLAAIGYDAEWDCIPAAAVGAPHLRARVWILAYPRGNRDATDDTVFAGRPELDLRPRWGPEPALARVADGLPGGVDVNALGNAAVPQIVEWIGVRIIEAMRAAA